MDVKFYVDRLNEIKPTSEEIAARLDPAEKGNSDLLKHLFEDCDYKMIPKTSFYSSEIYNTVYNSNIYEKGIDIFHFHNTPQKEFAYTDEEHIFFLDSGLVYVNIFGDHRLVSDSEDDFLLGLLCCFEANTEFVYRKHRFNLDDILLSFVEKVPGRNSDYFVEKLMFMYQS